MEKQPGKVKKWMKGFLKDCWKVFAETGDILIWAIAGLFGG
jgi:hypothetical protein